MRGHACFRMPRQVDVDQIEGMGDGIRTGLQPARRRWHLMTGGDHVGGYRAGPGAAEW